MGESNESIRQDINRETFFDKIERSTEFTGLIMYLEQTTGVKCEFADEIKESPHFAELIDIFGKIIKLEKTLNHTVKVVNKELIDGFTSEMMDDDLETKAQINILIERYKEIMKNIGVKK